MNGCSFKRPTGFSNVQISGLTNFIIFSAVLTFLEPPSMSRVPVVLARENAVHGGDACAHKTSLARFVWRNSFKSRLKSQRFMSATTHALLLGSRSTDNTRTSNLFDMHLVNAFDTECVPANSSTKYSRLIYLFHTFIRELPRCIGA